jgi:hypothetical protein
VLFGKWSGTEVKIDGQDLLIMKESDIMGVIEGGSPPKRRPPKAADPKFRSEEHRQWLLKKSNFPSTRATACCAVSTSSPTR